MRKRMEKSQVIVVAMLMVFGIGLLTAMAGLSRSIGNIDNEIIAREPEMVLANAGLSSGGKVSLPVAYFDQKQDKCVNLYDQSVRKELATRQFEWASCGYSKQQIEQGLVRYNLSEDYLPVGVDGLLLPNRGLKDMSRWFDSVEGKSKAYFGQLKVDYKVDETVEFLFANNDFYPLDTAEFSTGDEVNRDGHNHLFTMNFAVPFKVMADGEESFEIVADDDTFVFVGTELVLDMGGIHEATSGKFAINEAGEIYTAIEDEELAYAGNMVEEGESSIVRIFHADRDAGNGSTLRMKIEGMSLDVMQTQLANDSNGIQVAYDPSNPSYVGPLGESSTVRPDNTKSHIVVASILGVLIMICAMFIVFSIRILMKLRARK